MEDIVFVKDSIMKLECGLMPNVIIIIIITIIRKFITRTCSQALSLNRRRGQSLGG